MRFSFLKHLQTGRSDLVLSAVFGLKQKKKKIARKKENTFLACYVFFSQFRHVMFSFMIERHVTAVSTKAMTVNIGITQADSLCNNVDELINRGKIPRNNVWGVT